MPELPEITAYMNALERRIVGQPLERIRIASPSLLRSFDPPISTVQGRTVRALRRVGKRIIWELGDDLFLVIHLMITGRFGWKERGAPVPKKVGHAAFDFPNGTLLLTEMGTKKRASLHVVRGESALADHDRGGIEPLEADLPAFREALMRENRTLKRALTDPRLISGVGNAHSDEILLAARLSPVKRTHQLDEREIERLYDALQSNLREWTDRLLAEFGDGFPEKITAFHPAMAAHGKYGEPCPQCGTPIQRIVYAENETNYCPTCQTGGKLLADRSLSRLLKEDWPRTLEELDELKAK
ncbi:MAG: Fpg/Nei family DNA glycosylase [Longimicrobiales bacterium]